MAETSQNTDSFNINRCIKTSDIPSDLKPVFNKGLSLI